MNGFRTDGKRQERWLLPFSEKLHHATLCEVRQKKELAAWKIVLVAQWNEIWYTGKTRKGECFVRKLTALLLALITSLSLAACSFVALPMDPEQPTNQKQEQLAEDGTYTTKEDVARYIHLYGHLPDNFITKKEAQQLGWTGGSLEPYAPGCCIGGSRFGNYEGLLPEADGRTWTECDINTQGARSRGPERIVFSNDGLIYYTGDHYQTFELLYGGE